MRFRVEPIAPLIAGLLLAGCLGAGGQGGATARTAPVAAQGPALDYPVVLGEPFTIGEVTYEPVDKMNYDAVGRATVSAVGAAGVSAAHKTLPLPSYVEVTSLESGRTVLVRIERRGPMTNDRLIDLSAQAAAQLGGGEGTPVRVRRVNPAEAERALLRAGQEAPARMDTPKSLLAVLLRKLESGSASSQYASAPVLRGTEAKPEHPPLPATVPDEPVPARPAEKPAAAVGGGITVQVAAFSTRDRADAAARALGGHVVAERGYWHVRLGPYPDQRGAGDGLAKARAAGYSDARIRRAD